MKPVLLGMNNPHSTDPARALGVTPNNASGHRLWSMLAISAMCREPPMVVQPHEYEESFDRYNLLDEEVFDPSKFTIEREKFILDKLASRVVVMCGTNVPRALRLEYTGFNLKPTPAIIPGIEKSFTYYVIPHPSGLCREYNDPEMRSKVGKLLLMLYVLGGGWL